MPSEILLKYIYMYIVDCKISLASFVLYFHLLLIRSFSRIRSFFFVSWSLLQKLNFLNIQFDMSQNTFLFNVAECDISVEC